MLARTLLLLFALGTWAGGCAPSSDRLFALPLDRAPSDEDWSGAVSLRLEARGGRTSRPGEGDVDSDAVHTATASCHHGTGAPAVSVDARAFFTSDRLYLRFEWVDPTQDVGPVWTWQRGAWRASQGGAGEDGLGVLWGRGGDDFSCVRACHLQDWRMAEPRAFAEYLMATAEGAPPLDLWVWRAGRGRVGGVAEDARLGPKGREGDTSGDFDALNSANARAGSRPFQAGDSPIQAPPPEPGATAPGRVLLHTAPGRTEVASWSSRGRGRWVVVLSRALRGLDGDDVTFLPGREYRFGLSTLDGVAQDHNAVADPVRLLLVARQTLQKPKE